MRSLLLSDADRGSLLLQHEGGLGFVLRAHRNLPENEAKNLGQLWDDGLSSLAAVSGESLAVHGELLGHLKISQFGRAALVVPLHDNKAVIGLLTAVRSTPKPFSHLQRKALESITELALVRMKQIHKMADLDERVRLFQHTVKEAESAERQQKERIHGTKQPGNAVDWSHPGNRWASRPP